MDELREIFISANKENRLLDAIYEQSLNGQRNRVQIVEELYKLHNKKLINIVLAFNSLRNSTGQPDFFLTRHVFETLLPELNENVLDVMKCVIHLIKEAGNDGAAGMVIGPYVEFCAKKPSRPAKALKLIKDKKNKLHDVLTATLIAGARNDEGRYVMESIRLATDADIEIRKCAIGAIGKIQYGAKSPLINDALDSLSKTAVGETDDTLLYGVVRSAFDLYLQRKKPVKPVVNIIATALEKGESATLHAASEIIGFHLDAVPATLLKVLLQHLTKVDPDHKGTLDNIDYGLEKLLRRNDPKCGVNFLETLISANNGSISINAFDSVKRELYKNKKGLLDKLATRWLSMGNQALCTALNQVVKIGHKTDLLINVNPTELDSHDFTQLYFIARKAIGYLFYQPVTATAFILSLLPLANSRQSRDALTELLFDPLLINYPGQVRDYMKTLNQKNSGKSILVSAKNALKKFDEYIDTIKPVHELTEHHMPLDNSEAYRKHFSRDMTAAMKQAEQESVFLSMIKKSVLLYGRKSISYVPQNDAPDNRMEMPLQSFSTEIESPRLLIIDPLGLEHLLLTFRREELLQ